MSSTNQVLAWRMRDTSEYLVLNSIALYAQPALDLIFIQTKYQNG